jgi:ABC-type transport system involved in multi-copper enzyme maturation permease subunit
MAINLANSKPLQPSARLWNAFRHEIYKGRKQIFYGLVVASPLLASLLLIMVHLMIKLLSQVDPGIPESPIRPGQPYDLGSGSTFGISSRILFLNFGLLYNVLLILACILSVGNEYRWNTIKMLATRQPRRANLVLSKVLFAFSLIGSSFGMGITGWILHSLFLKFFYSVPFEITGSDWTALTGGLKYYGLTMLLTFIMALAAMTLTFRYKSVVAGVVCYFVYNTVDSTVSLIGASVANHGYGNVADWVKPLLDLAKALNPFLLNASVNRIAMVENYPDGMPNTAIITSNPIWWAWVMLGLYIVAFVSLAIYFVTQRDITD